MKENGRKNFRKKSREESISDTHVFSINKKTHVFNFCVSGLLISPNIEQDALALCLAMENIFWQPFTINLEKGFELGESAHGYGLSSYFDYNYDEKVLKHFLEEREKCLLQAEETKDGNNK